MTLDRTAALTQTQDWPAADRLRLAPDLTSWQLWSDDWVESLKSDNRSRHTIRLYASSIGKFATWVASERGRTEPEQVTSRDIRAWVVSLGEHVKSTGKPVGAGYGMQHLRNLKVFWAWWVSEESDGDHQPVNPAASVSLPKVPAKLTPILEDDDLLKLLNTAGSHSFADLRDTAIMRVLLDAGVRRNELLSMTLADTHTTEGVAIVDAKGGGTRPVQFGPRTAKALNRYLRARRTHPDAQLPQLWLSVPPKGHGALGACGINRMLKTRGEIAGIAGIVHPHRFRHTAFDAMDSAGVTGTQAMSVMGWKSRAMLDHYGASNAQRRALRTVRDLNLGDRV